MIAINLVPLQLRKKDSRRSEELTFLNIPKEVFLGVGGVFIILLIIAHGLLVALWTTKLSQHALLDAEWQRMLPQKNSIDGIGKEIKDIKAQLTKIKDLKSARNIVWSEKLNIVSDLIPKEVWLRKITWNEKVFNMEASAISSKHDEIVIAGNFVSGLKKENNFMKDFSSIELDSVNRNKKGELEVVDFIVTSNAK